MFKKMWVMGLAIVFMTCGISFAAGETIVNEGNTLGADITIGTNDNYKLNLETYNTPRITIDTSGNVGIGITEPSAKLEVTGDYKGLVYSTNDAVQWYKLGQLSGQGAGVEINIMQSAGFGNQTSIGKSVARLRIGNADDEFGGVIYHLGPVDNSANNWVEWTDDGTETMGVYLHLGTYYRGTVEIHNIHGFTLDPTPTVAVSDPSGTELTEKYIIHGNVGIGTTNPQSKLAVNGTITAKKVKVIETGWSDYVFNDDYKLASLEEVESYIKENKHLPGVPSATEVKSNGMDVSEIVKLQMAKIEELTLHVIELSKENKALSERIVELEKKGEE